MLFKCLLCFVLTSLAGFNVLCYQFEGDHCTADGRPATCKLLSQCPKLLEEIRRCGTPMPPHMRRRLQKLGCGFQLDEPMVCCDTSISDTARPFTSKPNSYPWESNEYQDPYNTGGGNQDNNNRDENNNNNNNNWDSNKNNVDNSIEKMPDVRNHRNLDLLPIECGAIEGERIFGGNRTRLFEMPWMVLLSYDSGRGTRLSCGGSLITKWYVLTAAHCISFLSGRMKLKAVILGEYDVRSDPDCERMEGQLFCAPKIRTVSIDTLIPHPDYSPQNLGDDIGLIRLAEPADFSLDSMKPICLPTSLELQSESLEGLNGVVAGWGTTEDGLQSPVLLSVDLPIISNRECQAIYTDGSIVIQNSQMCAGGVPDKDSCGGDSGGPLAYPGRTRAVGVRYVQRGIVSYGSKRCGIGGFPGVYTRVANYMNWILDNIRG